MNTLLLIVLPLIAVAIIALRYLSRLPAAEQKLSLSEHRTFDGLFAQQREEEARALAQADAEWAAEAKRAEILTRASAGETTALDEAHATGNREFYNLVLETLIAGARDDREKLRSTAKYIVDSGKLRSTAEFASRMIEQYQPELGPGAFTTMLYLAALSDNAEVYRHAVEIAREHFKQGRIPRLQRGDFIATVENGYWLISAETRYSGSGFTLKQLIAEVRRELAAATRLSA